MIPYFPPPQFTIFGHTVTLFAICVGVGLIVGNWFGHRRARQLGVSEDEIMNAVLWAIGFGFVGAHVFEIVFYEPQRLHQVGYIELLRIWDGISSFGGFIAGALGVYIYFVAFMKKPWMKHADIMMQSLVVGWVFGRLGCTVAFDHPGELSNFFLAFHYPGGSRHNLGFYEFLYTLFVMTPVILYLHRRNPQPGSQMAMIAMMYAPARFLMDFLRARESTLANSDLRYSGLTPAQWMCLVLFAYGIWHWRRIQKSQNPERTRK